MKTSIGIEDGAGGRETWNLVKELIVSKVPETLRSVKGGYGTDVLDDGALIPYGGGYLVITADSFTVNPIKFPGGNIGTLAVHGTLNDVVMMGGRPIAFMDTIIVEEGFPKATLHEITDSMISVLKREGVALIGGDFKVMPKSAVDKLVIAGVGLGITENPIIDTNISVGDKVIVTGPVAEHGAAILAAQLNLLDEVTSLRSDTKPLTRTVLPVIEGFGGSIHAARDPTRGGVAAVLNEWASAVGLTIEVERTKIPIRREVQSFLDAMGVDPLSTASEGVAILAVEPGVADEVINELRRSGETSAAVIGEVKEPPNELLRGKVVGVTEVGGRILIEAKSINLPRIC